MRTADFLQNELVTCSFPLCKDDIQSGLQKKSKKPELESE